MRGLLEELHRITAIEVDYLQSCLEKIEEMVSATMNSQGIVTNCESSGNGNSQNANNSPGPSTRQPEHPVGSSGGDKMLEHGKAGTPTDVRDVHF